MLTAQPYRTVVADPPWQPKMALTNGGAPKASPQLHYDTLSVPEIIAMRPNLAPQAHLYIWCLSQHVDWGYEVARAWGAEPIIVLTWKKPGLGAGRFRCNTEHVLLARVGSRHGNPFGGGGRYQQATDGTCFEWPRARHSEKPQEFFDLVNRLSPGPKLEMYARAPRDGWAVWGNQSNGAPIDAAPLFSSPLSRPKLCSHAAIISLDGKWHCQKCGDAIEMPTAYSHPSHVLGTENG